MTFGTTLVLMKKKAPKEKYRKPELQHIFLLKQLTIWILLVEKLAVAQLFTQFPLCSDTLLYAHHAASGVCHGADGYICRRTTFVIFSYQLQDLVRGFLFRIFAKMLHE